ncbi:SPOR domain-containing protein [Sphingomonas sp. SAFR-052]|uniref:SPOR domain-containing protein n=1 Tax=Sphingomonas sp. SAFR-052 TaxID=3436867 RepID=UPI003F81ACD3
MSFAALLLAAAGQVPAQETPPVVHAQLLDEVGSARVDDTHGVGMTVRHRTLASGSYAEVTALDSGRTVVLLVERDPSLTADNVVSLSGPAAKAIGVFDQRNAKIRIRPAVPSPAEQAAIRAGNEVPRLAAPPALLAALRRRLPSTPAPMTLAAAPKPTPRPATPVAAPAKPATPPPKPATTGRWFVQVAALSDATRAAALAKSVDGVVRSAGRLYRVQSGPFTTRAAAETARAAIARRGFADARIIAQD